GIRDFHVTGVQTCALPIFNAPASSRVLDTMRRPSARSDPTISTGEVRKRNTMRLLPGVTGLVAYSRASWSLSSVSTSSVELAVRSGERRVGKEGGRQRGPG